VVVSREKDLCHKLSLQVCLGEDTSLLVGKMNLVHEEASLTEYHALVAGKYFSMFCSSLVPPPVQSRSPSGTRRALYVLN
jgi:hypothetical protein